MNYMTQDDFHRLLKLIVKWDNLCIICGTPFGNIACVTVEHIIPKSKGGKGRRDRISNENLAPAHYQCNHFKEDNGFLETVKLIEQMRVSFGEKKFKQWVSKKVPGRQPIPEALLPLTTPNRSAALY